MFYLIGIKDNTTMCGSDATWHCHYVQRKKVLEMAERMRHMHKHDCVFAVRKADYTQKVCEMNSREQAEYFAKHAVYTV